MNDVDVKDVIEARLEAELDREQCEWQPLPEPPPSQPPPPPQPAPLALGFMPLAKCIAEKVGLPTGYPVNCDELGELMGAAAGYPARSCNPRKDVRPELWELILKGKQDAEPTRPSMVAESKAPSGASRERKPSRERRGGLLGSRTINKKARRVSRRTRKK